MDKFQELQRFLVFWVEHYYPNGPENDLEDSFQKYEEALNFIQSNPRSCGYYIIFDCDERKFIEVK